MEGYRILIVDDNDEINWVLSKYLQLIGFSTETARDGMEGLNKFINQHFDLVLTDIEMPYMDGLALAHELRKLQPKPVIIIMTGDILLSLHTERLADFVLVKPFELKELDQTLQICIRNQEPRLDNQDESGINRGSRNESMTLLKDDFGYQK